MRKIISLLTGIVLAAHVSAVCAQEQVRIEYDALGRLTNVTRESGPNSGTTAVYTYDAASNRTNVTVSGARKRIVVVPLNGFTIIPLN